MICIRLSEEEYFGLKRLCAITRARSVSDLTRDSIRAVLNGVNRDDILGLRMDQFQSALKNLDRKIDQLAEEISGAKAYKSPN